MRGFTIRLHLASARGPKLAGLIALAFAFPSTRVALAQAPDDANRVSLEAKIAALQPLACAAPTTPPDPQVAPLKGVLDAYSKQYGAILDAQIAVLSSHKAPSLSSDDQDVMAAARQKKRAALADVCGASGQGVFTAPGGANPVKAPAPKPVLAGKIEITPAVVRAGQVGVSDQGEASVTIKNNTGEEVRLGTPEVCLQDKTVCLPQGEVFQVADGVDKCKNPLAQSDQCTLKILFTPRRSFDYSQWLKVPLVDASGVAMKEDDGTPNPPLMISLQGKGFVDGMAHVEATETIANHPSLRSVVGLDIGGATSTDTQQKLFVDFALNAPIGFLGYTVCSDASGAPKTDRHGKVIGDTTKVIRSYEDCQNLRSQQEKDQHVRYGWKDQHADPLESRLWWYFNPRITSIPQQASALSSLNVQGFTDSFTAQKTSLVQGVDVQGGLEFMLVKPRDGRAFYGSYKNTKARLGLAWVVGGGFASPFAAPGNNPTVFTLDAASPLRHQFQATGTLICGANSPCDIPASFTNITFVNPERSRFFRKYYTGLRLKTYHFSQAYSSQDCDPGYKNECEGVYNAYPGILDITAGQDEQVTGGHLSNWLLRLDAAYPLPFLPGTYIFGGVNSAFLKNQNTAPVFLPGTSTTAISDPSVFQVQVPLRNRDNYRLGLGVDLLQVITRAKQGSNKNQAGTGTTPPPSSTADSDKSQ